MMISRSVFTSRWNCAPGWAAFILLATAPLAILAAPMATEPGEDDPAAAAPASPPTLAAGHSMHGDAFDDGPRQKAYLMGGTGKVSLPVTASSAEAQAFFDQGVGQLHGFWYYESERSFRHAAMLSPDCAMAYWGMAMSNVNNEKRARKFIAKAVEQKAKASRREQLWIDAYAKYFDEKSKDNRRRREQLVGDLENIIHEFPEETEAKAFLAVQLWTNSSNGIPIPSRVAVNSLIKEVLAKEPMHPVHHYAIHLWDDARAQTAIESAARCGQSAPSIAHMWHMPGHTFTKMKRYADAAWQQEASARVDHAHMIRDHVMPFQIHNYAHNNEWCAGNLMYVGRAREALALAKNLSELPRHPKYNTVGSGGAADNGRRRLFEVLSKFEMWDDVLALADNPALEPTDKEDEQLRRIRLIGAARFGKGQFEEGQKHIEELKTRLAANESAAQKADEEAVAKAKNDKKNDADAAKAGKSARKKHDDARRKIEESLAEMRGRRAFARGAFDEANFQFKKAGNRIDKELSSRTYLGEKKFDKAIELAKKAVDESPEQVAPLANFVFVLSGAGKAEEAAAQFKTLRRLAGHADRDLAAITRLADFARSQGVPEDWREPAPQAADAGVRPALDSLGPLCWSPYAASDWTLADGHGKPSSLGQYRGKPVVVIFYLGYGCLHCVEQLNNFASKTTEFADAGIPLLAVSTDPLPDLQKSIEKCAIPGGFPFPIVSDSALDVFKQYRAYDDFENAAMHATFLIDGEGRVRWQDIGPDPFNDPAFLLKEAKRLLAQ